MQAAFKKLKRKGFERSECRAILMELEQCRKDKTIVSDELAARVQKVIEERPAGKPADIRGA